MERLVSRSLAGAGCTEDLYLQQNESSGVMAAMMQNSVSVCVCVCVCVCVRMCVHTCMCVHVHVCMYVCVCAHVYMCECVCVFTVTGAGS